MIVYNSHCHEKTLKAIVYSYITLSPIIVMDELSKKRILKKAKDIGISIPTPKTINEIKMFNYELKIRSQNENV